MLALLTLMAVTSPAQPPTREQVIDETMQPYRGPSARGGDPKTLTGKVMSGYQGWFTTWPAATMSSMHSMSA